MKAWYLVVRGGLAGKCFEFDHSLPNGRSVLKRENPYMVVEVADTDMIRITTSELQTWLLKKEMRMEETK